MHKPHHLTLYPDPILRKKGEVITELTPSLEKFIEEMKQICAGKNGLGIAAPQVNESLNLFVTPVIGTHIKTKEPLFAKSLQDWTVVINPKITTFSKEFVGYEEGCLSLPQIYSMVYRPKAIEVTYQDLEMKTHTKVLTHWFARIFMHEYDHLLGVLFTDYLLETVSNGALQDTNVDKKLAISKALSQFEQKKNSV